MSKYFFVRDVDGQVYPAKLIGDEFVRIDELGNPREVIVTPDFTPLPINIPPSAYISDEEKFEQQCGLRVDDDGIYFKSGSIGFKLSPSECKGMITKVTQALKEHYNV